MKNGMCLMTLYRTTVDGNWKQTACTAHLAAGGLDGNDAARLTRLLQRRLGLGYEAARQLVASLFSGQSGTS